MVIITEWNDSMVRWISTGSKESRHMIMQSYIGISRQLFYGFWNDWLPFHGGSACEWRPTSLFERRDGQWDSQADLVRKCSLWSVFYKNDFCGRLGWVPANEAPRSKLRGMFKPNLSAGVPHTTSWTTHRRWQGKSCLLVERISHICPR